MNLIGNDISAYTVRKRVFDRVMAALNAMIMWASTYDLVVGRTRRVVDATADPMERSIFNAVESVMAETHRMFPGNAVTFAAGWNPGMTFTTMAAPTTLTAPMIITAPHQIGGQP